MWFNLINGKWEITLSCTSTWRYETKKQSTGRVEKGIPTAYHWADSAVWTEGHCIVFHTNYSRQTCKPRSLQTAEGELGAP